MKHNVKKIAAACAAVCVLAAVPLTVYAYLQSEPKKENNFSIGEDKQRVTEVFTEPSTMQMSNTFEKKVMVENNGSSDQFVRVYLDFSDSRVRDKSKIVYKKKASDTDTVEKSWTDFLTNLPDNWAYISETATDGDVLGGYFYYTKILKPGDKTTNLIEGIKTNFGDDGNTDNINDFNIIVYSESVQTVEINTSGTVYSDYKDAWKSFLQ